MICQEFVLRHPTRCLLISVFSSTNSPGLPNPSFAIVKEFASAQSAKTHAEILDRKVSASKLVINSKHFCPETSGRRHEECLVRSSDTSGVPRQASAIAGAPDRSTRLLQHVRIPVLVVHGDQDNLVPYVHGVATAKAIPHSRFHTMRGVGHAILAPYVPSLVQDILQTTREGAVAGHNSDERPEGQKSAGLACAGRWQCGRGT
jgi:pimeloyl-ACP methyl ester carboxylesterase